MHELTLVRNLLEILEEAARVHGFSRVGKVMVEIGAFSSAEEDSIRFGFEVAAKGTLAEGAILEFIRTPGTGYCNHCGNKTEIIAPLDQCPLCGGNLSEISGGDALRVVSVEAFWE